VGQRSPSDVRLRAALQFSSLSLVVMLAWAFFLWLLVGWMGWRVHASQSIGATMIVAASEFILFSGAVGLTYALFGRGAGVEQ